MRRIDRSRRGLPRCSALRSCGDIRSWHRAGPYPSQAARTFPGCTPKRAARAEFILTTCECSSGGVQNLLRHLHILPGEPTPAKTEMHLFRKRRHRYVAGGQPARILDSRSQLLEPVRSGKRLGHTVDLHSETVGKFLRTRDGVVALIRQWPVIFPGDGMFLVTGLPLTGDTSERPSRAFPEVNQPQSTLAGDGKNETRTGFFRLDSKIALVSGGTGIVGSPVASALAEAGATVIVASRDVDRCRAFAESLCDQV